MERIDINETVLFTTLSQQKVLEARVSEVVKFLQYIALTNNYQINKRRGFLATRELLLKSVIQN